MSHRQMCTIIKPYKCPNCNNELLFFTINRSDFVIDYKNLINKGLSLHQLREYLSNRNIRYLKCIICKKMYIIDWSNGFPEPLLNRNVLTQFGYKF